ncbi:MAG: imidazolonepropionase-like amidohydrolase [Saprospiraceae bacterium]|jgi:imidazolonepropionase-like amidohydrolase
MIFKIRRRIKIIVTLIVIGSWCQVYSQDLVIKNANFLNVITGIYEKGHIQISQGVITSISKDKFDESIESIDATGKFIIPGLIDAHIHLFQSGGLYTRPDAIDLRHILPYEEERIWMIENAEDILRRYLRLGITTVIDVGGPNYNLRLRDQITNSRELPNIWMTGPLISTYLPPELDVNVPPIMKANSMEEARQMVRDQLALNPDFIKIWYISLPNQNAESTLDIVKAAIVESHLHNLRVAVHATELNTAKLAIHAGADILVHSVKTPVDDDFLRMLEENEVSYIPTLYVHGNYDRVFGEQFDPSDEDHKYAPPIPLGSIYDIKDEELKQQRASFRSYIPDMIANNQISDSIRRANLKIVMSNKALVATGTDAGNIGTMHASAYYDEIALMKLSGLSNFDILKASTINGAKVLNREASIGSIASGKMADLLILDSNPLEDIDGIQNIHRLVKGGKVHHPDTIVAVTSEHLVQQQLNGYNARNIDAFLLPYADDVKIYNFPNDFLYEGKEKMRENYSSMFEKTPGLHCELKHRIIMGNTVIDQERVTGFPNGYILEATAIYKIKNDRIAEVYFIRKE